MTAPHELAESRKELHGSISPVVYTAHARQEILDDISRLRFPDSSITDPLGLALSAEVKHALEFSPHQAKTSAKRDGMIDVLYGHSVHNYGYGDRHFTPEFASGLGREVSDFLQKNGVINEGLSLRDYAKLFQTGWFGETLNQCAITGIGMLQPYYDRMGRKLFQNGFTFQPSETGGLKTGRTYADTDDYEPYELEVEDESGLLIVGLKKESKKILRANMRKATGVGCPVARTAIKATEAQVEFLESQGHLELSGFWVDERQMATEGMVKLSQGPYTAIDDVAWQWGDYVDRYARHLLRIGNDPEGIELTSAGKFILLD